MFTVLVAGSRTYNDYEEFVRIMDKVLANQTDISTEFDEEEYKRQYPSCKVTDEEREELLRKLMGDE